MRKQPFIRLLTGGDLVIETPGAIDWKGRSSKALFALLALHPGEPVSRDRLAGLLWSESDQQAARASLRTALMTLRRAIAPLTPDLIEATNDTIALNVGREEIDWALFEVLAHAENAEHRLAALDLYRGDLSMTLPKPHGAADELLRDKREALRDLAIGVGVGLIEAFESGGGDDQVRGVTRKVLGIDPANEGASRSLMRCCLRAGDHVAALRQFETCRTALAETYDLRPSPETVALRDEILAAQRRPREHDASAGAPAPAHATLGDRRLKSPAAPRARWWHRRRKGLAAALSAIVVALALVAYFAAGLRDGRVGSDPPRLFLDEIGVIDLGCDDAGLARRTVTGLRDAILAIPGLSVVLQKGPDRSEVAHLGTRFLEIDVQCSADRYQFVLRLSSRDGATPLWVTTLTGDGRSTDSMIETAVRELRARLDELTAAD